eukprot:766744-Amphidinium_carterae.1
MLWHFASALEAQNGSSSSTVKRVGMLFGVDVTPNFDATASNRDRESHTCKRSSCSHPSQETSNVKWMAVELALSNGLHVSFPFLAYSQGLGMAASVAPVAGGASAGDVALWTAHRDLLHTSTVCASLQSKLVMAATPQSPQIPKQLK